MSRPPPPPTPALGSGTAGAALPVLPPQLIGRDADTTTVAALVTAPTGRLLTVTGPGGVGKTSLALAVAHRLAPAYPAGVAWVALAAVTAPAQVIGAIAGALGLRETGETPLPATLRAYLQPRALLLVLDNLEQVVAAAPEIGSLLAAAPGLRILATSRVPLHLRGERIYPLPPLARPDPAHLPALAALSEVAAVALFVARAQAVQPAFQLTAENATPVAQVCARLDGLPLALELAAARLRLLSPAALLARLARALPLLTGGPRDAPLRHQTLRATIAWSYDLLTGAEQRLFRRLSVFAGSAPLAGVTAVCAAEDAMGDLLDGLTALLDHSLLTQTMDADGEPRFRMLETLREYAAEQLAAAGEAGAARAAHAAYYGALVAEAEPALQEGRQAQWLARLEEEDANVRAALGGLLAAGDPAAGALAGGIWRFWYVRGHLSEGRRLLAQVLALPALPAASRAKVLNGAGVLALAQDAYAPARALLAECLAGYRALDHALGMASALNNLGIIATEEGDYPAAQAAHEEALVLRRRLGDHRAIAASLNNLGALAGIQRAPQRARELFAEALALRRALDDTRGVALVLANLGDAARDMGDPPGAIRYYKESVAQYRALGDRVSLSLSLTSLADLYRAARDLPAALRLYQESLGLSLALGSPAQQAENLRGLAAGATIGGQPELAARLFGVAATIQDPLAGRLPPAQQAAYDAAVAQARAAIGPLAWTVAWTAGRAESPAAILAALPFPELLAPPAALALTPNLRSDPGLTRREREVLRLLVTGLSYNEIADQLSLSFHTVHAHLRTIYGKLGVTSRAQATHLAGEQRLV
ncbi:MAG TPA: tetratricopeptide repeat protein [Chloroflexia bacterium]|nr:tetratricopeptide repeat protein [Chloroflexia bacterium]